MSLYNKDVLVIEDNYEARIVLKKILTTAGATYHEQESISDAIDYARHCLPYLILLDLNLKGETGLDFLHEKKKTEFLKEVPVIVVSAANDRQTVLKAIQLGADDYLLKPISTAILLDKMNRQVKDSTFMSRKVNEREFSDSEMYINGQITSFSASGLTIDSSARFGTDEIIHLTSSLLNFLNLSNLKFKTRSETPVYCGNKRYRCEVQFVGFNSEQLRRLQTTIFELKEREEEKNDFCSGQR